MVLVPALALDREQSLFKREYDYRLMPEYEMSQSKTYNRSDQLDPTAMCHWRRNFFFQQSFVPLCLCERLSLGCAALQYLRIAHRTHTRSAVICPSDICEPSKGELSNRTRT